MEIKIVNSHSNDSHSIDIKKLMVLADKVRNKLSLLSFIVLKMLT